MQKLSSRPAGGINSQKRNGTVLFADVAGFTSFAERLGEEVAFDMIQGLSSTMQDAIHTFGGTVGEFRGDGIMALFGVTTGLEDGPLRACQAALHIQARVGEARAEMTRRYGEAPRVRIGLHCGPLVVGDVSDGSTAHVTIIGDAANVASRLESAAEPGQILISQDLMQLVDGQVEVRDLGPVHLKGKTKPLQIFQLEHVREKVTRFGVAKSRGLSTFCDRASELARLGTILDQAREGRIVLADIKGEPGIGKSRLVHEFMTGLSDGVRVLNGDCRAGGAETPFLPFADLLRNLLALEDGATAEKTARHIDRMLAHTGFGSDDVRQYYLKLLGKAGETEAVPGESADMIGARMRQVLVDSILYTARNRAVVLIIEDLHWADRGTVRVIDQLVRTDAHVPLMVLCTYRPTFDAPWQNFAGTHLIAPPPISEAGVSAIIQEIMSGSSRSAELATLAVEKADGNPLYAEEIAKFLMQQDDLSGTMVLPASLQNMVMERFDKLDGKSRAVLQAGSAIGRKFDACMAHRIAGDIGEFDTGTLEAAVIAEIILPSDQVADEFRFKHALVQDAIYDTLLATQRRGLHALVAQELENRFSNRPEEAAESLAWHFDAADMPRKAVPNLITAGMRNLGLFSLDAANRSFARAFALVQEHDLTLTAEQTATLFSGWFEVQQWRAEFGRTVSLFESQKARLQIAHQDPRYARILGLAGVAYCQNMQFKRARVQLDEAIAIGERTNDRDAIIYGSLGLMVIECTRPQPGYWERSHLLVARINDLLGDEPHPYYRTYCTFYESWSHSIRGDLAFPIEKGHALFDLGKRINFSGAIGWGAICIAYNEAQSENFDVAIEYASAGAEAAGGLVDRMVCLAIQGYSMLMTARSPDQIAAGTRIIEEVSALGEALDYRGVENMVDGPLGLAKVLAGDLGGGVRRLHEAIGNAMETGNLHGAAQSHVALGMIYLKLATGTERPSFDILRRNAMFLLREAPFAKSRAIAQFDTAIDLGRKVEMFGVVAQALFGKGMVLKAKRKPDAARAALVEAQEVLTRINWPMMTARVDRALKEMEQA